MGQHKLCKDGRTRTVAYGTIRRFVNTHGTILGWYPVRNVDLHNGPVGTGTLIINFGTPKNTLDTSSYAAVEFASFAVMLGQVARWHALQGVPLFFNGVDSGGVVDKKNVNLKT